MRDSQNGDIAGTKRRETFLGERFGDEGNERVGCAGGDEGVVEGENAGEVGDIGYERRPDWDCKLDVWHGLDRMSENVPLGESVTCSLEMAAVMVSRR